MSAKPELKTLDEVIGLGNGKRADKIDYPIELINKFLLLCPEREDIAEEMRKGSRHVDAMLSEISLAFKPADVIDRWHTRRDTVLTEAYRLKDLEQLVKQVKLVIVEAEGHL